MDFDVEIFADWILRIRPEFVNLGADSKAHGLPEPPYEKVIEVREKRNLERLKKGSK